MPPLTTDWSLDDRPLLRADRARYPMAYKANSFSCPIGQLPGKAWLLMRREDIANIIDGGARSHSLRIRVHGKGLGTGTIAFPSLVILSARNVSGGATGDRDAAYLVELADVRHLAMMTSVTAMYNVKHPSPAVLTAAVVDPQAHGGTPNPDLYYEDSLDDSQSPSIAWTFESMMGDIWGNMPMLPAWPGYKSDVHNYHPEDIILNGVSAWTALCDLLDADVRIVPVYDPVAGSFEIKSHRHGAGADALLTSAGKSTLATGEEANEQRHKDGVIYDDDPLAAYKLRAPAKLEMMKHRLALPQSINMTDREESWIGDRSTRKHTTTTNVPGAISGTKLPLWVLQDQYVGPLEDDSGDSPPQAAGHQVAEAVLGSRGHWHQGSKSEAATTTNLTGPVLSHPGHHRIYTGIAAGFRPSIFNKLVQWRDYGDGTMTEVAWQPGIPENYEQSGDGAVAVQWGLGERSSPPDLGRRSVPIQPDLCQIVRVVDDADDDEVLAGTMVDPTDSHNLIPGKIVVYSDAVSAENEELEDCWIHDIDRPQTTDSQPKGALFIGRLTGSAKDGSGDWRPVVYVNSHHGNYFDSHGDDTAAGQMDVLDNDNFEEKWSGSGAGRFVNPDDGGHDLLIFSGTAAFSANSAVLTVWFTASTGTQVGITHTFTAPSDVATQGDKVAVTLHYLTNKTQGSLGVSCGISSGTITWTDCRMTGYMVGMAPSPNHYF